MKRYYAGYNQHGIGTTYVSDGWKIKRFDSKFERDNWVAKYKFEGGKVVVQTLTCQEVERIIGRYKNTLLPCHWEENECGWLECKYFINDV